MGIPVASLRHGPQRRLPGPTLSNGRSHLRQGSTLQTLLRRLKDSKYLPFFFEGVRLAHLEPSLARILVVIAHSHSPI